MHVFWNPFSFSCSFWESPQRIIFLHLTLFLESSPSQNSWIFSVGFPLAWQLYLLCNIPTVPCTWPNTLSLASLTLSLICSFLILYLLVSPDKSLSIFNSATSISAFGLSEITEQICLSVWSCNTKSKCMHLVGLGKLVIWNHSLVWM